jgi:succinate dehydrogenase / fumarate reductase cytochrome b subunit
MAELSRKRPKHLDLMAIRLPLAGIASILHRVSGAGLFLMLPLLIYLLQLSLGSPEDFALLRRILAFLPVKLVLFGLLWAFLHHFCMGIRILLIDVHVGVEKASAALSAKLVLGVSLILTLILGVKILW